MSTLIFITYDGINNSVFEGQVLYPLRMRKMHKTVQKIILISFERNPDLATKSKTLTFAKDICDEVHILKRLPYLGRLSLYHSVGKLKTILKKYSSYDILTRGPLAGWIAQQSRDAAQCSSITIQARGLCAEEYAYTHTTQSWIKSWWHRWRYRSLKSLEYAVYSKQSCSIESVSPALSTYLIDTFHAQPSNILAASFDAPSSITLEQKQQWRVAIRKQVGISDTAHVYCYNGSMKSWQCPEMVVAYFEFVYQQNSHSFLLVLTQDVALFTTYLRTTSLPLSSYTILHVSHHDIYKYLSAADKGIIFRKPSIINWVSRPTKVLEYRAAQLDIIHNNTIGMLYEPRNTDTSGNSYFTCR